MATEVNIADMNSIPEIYLWVPTTLPISIYTPSLMIYLNNWPIYQKQGRPELPIGPISEIWTHFDLIITISLIKNKKILTKFYSI